MKDGSRVIGVIGDTHVPERLIRLPTQVLEVLSRVDLIVHTGDFTDHAVFEELTSLAPVKAVHGNMDDTYLSILLPETETFEMAGRRIGLIHGWGPRNGLSRRVLSRLGMVDVLIYGHSHEPHKEWVNGSLLINPGSCAGNVDGSRSFLVLELGETIKTTPVKL